MCVFCRATRTSVIRKGFYARGKRRIQRYFCKECRRYFSDQTTAASFREKKAHLNQSVFRLLCSGVSQRETAYILGTQPRTIARKLVRLARVATRRQGDDLAQRPLKKTIVFDEMETFEHTKCKPLSIAVAVEEGSRRIIAMEVARMPAKGRLSAISRKRYGHRRDDRPAALRRLLTVIKRTAGEDITLKSDESPRYPKYVGEVLPRASHVTYKGRRGCVVGQGELKRGGHDPLFSLNHTCAMARDRIKRLSRRTWCTTKRPDRLQCLLRLMTYFHNQRLIHPKKRVVL